MIVEPCSNQPISAPLSKGAAQASQASRLMSLIASADSGEACACDLVAPLGRSQPTVSHHLSVLVDAGFLHREKRGKWAWYRAVPERIELLRAALGPAQQ